MVWYAWVMVGGSVLGALAAIGMIGRPRDPITPATAIGLVINTALWIWGIVSLAAH